MVAIVSLLVIAMVSLLAVRAGSTALMMTGLSWDMARSTTSTNYLIRLKRSESAIRIEGNRRIHVRRPDFGQFRVASFVWLATCGTPKAKRGRGQARHDHRGSVASGGFPRSWYCEVSLSIGKPSRNITQEWNTRF